MVRGVAGWVAAVGTGATCPVCPFGRRPVVRVSSQPTNPMAESFRRSPDELRYRSLQVQGLWRRGWDGAQFDKPRSSGSVLILSSSFRRRRRRPRRQGQPRPRCPPRPRCRPSGPCSSSTAVLPRLAGRSFLPLAFLARLPISMTQIGTVVLVSTTFGSIASRWHRGRIPRSRCGRSADRRSVSSPTVSVSEPIMLTASLRQRGFDSRTRRVGALPLLDGACLCHCDDLGRLLPADRTDGQGALGPDDRRRPTPAGTPCPTRVRPTKRRSSWDRPPSA